MSRNPKLILLAIIALFVLSGVFLCVERYKPYWFDAAPASQNVSVLQQDIYIWQRVWTPALLDSMQTIKGSVQRFHVLAAEFGANEKTINVRVNFPALQETQLPVYAVVRIDGRSKKLLSAATRTAILTLAVNWQKKLPGLEGIEIDYDCPTSQLAVYTQFLKDLRAAIPSSLKLTNTALPTWLESPLLHDLLLQTDSSILQIHAVSKPEQGLFNETQSLAWVNAYQKRTKKPFQIALPAYGSKVIFSTDGKILTIQSEQLTLNHFNRALELAADPKVVASFIEKLRSNHIANIIWFRLPTIDDQRAWPITSLLAVMHQQLLLSTLKVGLVPELNSGNDKYHKDEKSAGLANVVVSNQGNIAAEFPVKITVTATQDCKAADGINGYRLELGQGIWIFKREQTAMLLPQQQRVIAWLHCSPLSQSALDKLHVTFE